MSVLDYIERLREGSEGSRKRAAFVVALSLTGIIGIGWFMSFSGGSRSFYNSQTALTSTTSPLAAIGDAFRAGSDLFSGIFNDVTNLVSETKTIFSATTSIATSSASE